MSDSKLSSKKFTNNSYHVDGDKVKNSSMRQRKFEQIEHHNEATAGMKDVPSPKNNAQRRSMLGPNEDRS
jgi:hypothetical protein